MRSARDWDDVVLTGAPRLVVGWRPRARRLDAARVEVHGDAEKHLRDIGAATLSRLAQLTAVPYGDAVLPEPGEEYMSISLQAYAAGPQDVQDAAQVADLLRIVRDPDAVDTLSAERLREGSFVFYALCFPQPDDEMIAAVRAVSPTRALRRASFWGRYAGTLRRVERPDVVLEDIVDLVVTDEEVAILNRTAYDRLFSDLDSLAAAVPADVAALAAAMPSLPFAPGSEDALTSLCTRLPSFAKRLHAIAARGDLALVDADALQAALAGHGEDAGHWLDQAGCLTLTEKRAKEFVDVIEGRWWTSDFTGERRRADRYRPRR